MTGIGRYGECFSDYLLSWFTYGTSRSTLGGKLPDALQVNCPTFSGSVRFEIPPTADGYKDFTRKDVIAKFEKTLEKLPDWQDLKRRTEMRGRKMMLCWRTDTKLDWLWVDDDVEGMKREWEVVYGLMLASVSPTCISRSSLQPY